MFYFAHAWRGIMYFGYLCFILDFFRNFGLTEFFMIMYCFLYLVLPIYFFVILTRVLLCLCLTMCIKFFFSVFVLRGSYSTFIHHCCVKLVRVSLALWRHRGASAGIPSTIACSSSLPPSFTPMTLEHNHNPIMLFFLFHFSAPWNTAQSSTGHTNHLMQWTLRHPDFPFLHPTL